MRSIRQVIVGIGREAISKAPPPRAPAAAPAPFRLLGTRIFTPPAPSQREALSAYETNPFVHTIVDRVASICAGQDFFLRRRSDRGRKILDHPALDFLHAGNEIMDGYQARRLMQAHIDLAGEAFLLKGYDKAGRPASYLPVPPTWVLQVAYRPGEAFELSLPRGAGTAVVPYEAMIWLKRARPADPLDRGFSPTRALITEIALNNEIGTYFYNFVKNRARPDVIITGTDENPFQKDDVAAMERVWLQNHGGSSKSGKPFFSNVPIELHEVGQTVAESKSDEMRKISRDFITETYGIPPELFGRVENSNRATSEAADYIMARYVIEPRLKASCEGLYPALMADFPDLARYTLHAESPVQEDKDRQLNAVRAAPSAFRKNDVRIMAGLEPVEGGDEFLKPSGGTAGTGAGDPGLLADGNAASPKKILRAFGDAEREAIDDALSEAEPAHLALLLIMLRSAATGAAIHAGVPHGVAATTLAGAVTAWADERADKLIPLLNDTSAAEMRAAAEATDGSRSAMIAAILALALSWASSRSRTVATTEANGAMGAASGMVAAAAGLPSKVWLTRQDERVRGLHRPMHLQVKAAAELYVAPNGETGMAPGGFASAAMNVNCRCASHVYRGDPPTEAEIVRLLAGHEAFLRSLESTLAMNIQSLFMTQAQAVIAAITRLGQ